MCGLFGFCAKKGGKINLRKVDLLGIFNTQRGVDSCGYYFSGFCNKGVNTDAVWSVFTNKTPIIRGDLKHDLFIGHTRKSTSGGNSCENAHPHIINDYIQTHNGVIKNIWDLCREYDIDHRSIAVDSVGLAHIIEKHGFEVLNKYEGYAALSFAKSSEPDTLYLYHGASKEKEDGEVLEERPLFVLDQKEGLYYSSLKESLDFIKRRTTDVVETLPLNKVFKVIKGIIQDNPYIVKRDDCNVIKFPIIQYSNYCRNTQNFNAIPKELPFPKKNISLPPITKDILYKETFPNESLDADVFFRKGRHYRDVNTLLQGHYKIDRDGYIIKKNETSPKNKLITDYYFIRGVMLNDKRSYDECLAKHPYLSENCATCNVSFVLSKYSKYPVTNSVNEGTILSEDVKDIWWYKQLRFSGTLYVRFSKRKYHITHGKLLSIDAAGISDEPLGKSVSLIKDVVDDPSTNSGNIDISTAFSTGILRWAHMSLTKDMVLLLPEYFLYFLDFYNSFYDGNISDKVTEEYTSQLLRDLIFTKQTFSEFLKDRKKSYMLDPYHIKECFDDLDLEELAQYDNRYNYISFEEECDEYEAVDGADVPVLENSKNLFSISHI